MISIEIQSRNNTKINHKINVEFEFDEAASMVEEIEAEQQTMAPWTSRLHNTIFLIFSKQTSPWSWNQVH